MATRPSQRVNPKTPLSLPLVMRFARVANTVPPHLLMPFVEFLEDTAERHQTRGPSMGAFERRGVS
jgi:hypothetical protein